MSDRRITTVDVARWNQNIGGFDGTPGLRDAFVLRWEENVMGLPPAGLPGESAISQDYGWSTALELYLMSFETANASTKRIQDAIRAADEALAPEARGDAWLADILALRRSPPQHVDGGFPEGPDHVDMNAALFMLDSIASISRELPIASDAAYRFFRRLYDALATALVSEVIEASGPGAVLLDHASGTRLVAPDTRSVFRTLAALRRPAKLWGTGQRPVYESIIASWARQIGELSDSIALLNEGLENLALAPTPWAARDKAALLTEHQASHAREFDHAFYRFLVADNPVRDGHNADRAFALRRALEELYERDADHFGPPAGLHVDIATAQGALWEGESSERSIEFNEETGEIVVRGMPRARYEEAVAAYGR